MGVSSLLFCFSGHYYPFVTESFTIMGYTLNLPRITLPPYLIMLALAVVANFLALFANSSAVAMGAAVFYGVTIGFRPEFYPYVVLEILLCMIASARMSGKNYTQSKSSTSVKDTAAGSSANSFSKDIMTSKAVKAMTAKKANASNTTYTYQYSGSYEEAKKKNDEIIKMLDGRGSSADLSPLKYLFIGLFVAFLVLAGVTVALKYSSYQIDQNTRSTTEQTSKAEKLRKLLEERAQQDAGTLDGTSTFDDNVGSTSDDNGNKDTTGGSTSGDTGKDETSAGGSASGGSTTSGNEDSQTKDIPDLTGYWTMRDSSQSNSGSSTTSMVAQITEDTIEVYWLTGSNNTRLIFWSGTYTPPTTSELPYKWSSMKNAIITANSAFASPDTIKLFTYDKDGALSFTASTMGLQYPVKLYKDDNFSFDV